MTSQVEDADLQKYIALIKVVIDKFVKGNGDLLSIFDIATIAMSVVEELKQERYLSGPQKKKLALEILNIVVETLVSLGKIDSDKGEELKKLIHDNSLLITQFIDIAAFLTKNPEIINAGKFVVTQTRQACGKCFGCCSLT